MNRVKIEQINKTLPQIIIGTATPALDDSPNPYDLIKPNRTESFRLLDELWEMGLNMYDCAAGYGEPGIGEYLTSRKRHKDAIIITKCSLPNRYRKRVTPYDMESDLNDSLAKLKTDYIDVYLLHRDDTDAPVEMIIETLNRFYKKGKIGVFGGSNWTIERIKEANKFAKENGFQPFAVNSPNYGLAHQVQDPWGGGCQTLTGPEHESDREWCIRERMPIFAYSSLARGFFSGYFKSNEPEKAEGFLDKFAKKGYYYLENMERLARTEQLAKKYNCTVAKIAISWMIHQTLQVFPILSGPLVKYYQEAIDSADLTLTEEEVAWLDLR